MLADCVDGSKHIILIFNKIYSYLLRTSLLQEEKRRYGEVERKQLKCSKENKGRMIKKI